MSWSSLAWEDLAVRDVQAALNRIAGILAGFTFKRTTMESEYAGHLNVKYSEGQKLMILDMTNLHRVSDNGKKGGSILCSWNTEPIRRVKPSCANTKNQILPPIQGLRRTRFSKRSLTKRIEQQNFDYIIHN